MAVEIGTFEGVDSKHLGRSLYDYMYVRTRNSDFRVQFRLVVSKHACLYLTASTLFVRAGCPSTGSHP